MQKSFTYIANEWLIMHSTNIKSGTYRMYAQKVTQLSEIFGDKNISKITYIDLQNVINTMYTKGLAKSTIHKTKITLGMIFTHALKNRIVTSNPCDFVSVPKQAKTSTRTGITDVQISIVLKSLNHSFGLYPFMLLLLGLRRSELVALKYEDIDFAKRQIHIHTVVNYCGNKPVLYEGLKNGNKDRYITLPNILFEQLYKEKEMNGYIFKNDSGQVLLQNQLRKLWDNYKADTGCTATQHMLRHTYATLLYKSDVDIKTAQYLMGHNDVRTMLQIYTHMSEQEQKKNIDKFDVYLNKNFHH